MSLVASAPPPHGFLLLFLSVPGPPGMRHHPVLVIRDIAITGDRFRHLFQGTSGTYQAFSIMRNCPPVLQNSGRRLSAVGPYTYTERLLVAIRQANGSL